MAGSLEPVAGGSMEIEASGSGVSESACGIGRWVGREAVSLSPAQSAAGGVEAGRLAECLEAHACDGGHVWGLCAGSRRQHRDGDQAGRP